MSLGRKYQKNYTKFSWVEMVILVWTLYLVASGVYLWRNPKANTMMVFKDFKHVIKFEKLDTYQK